MSETVAECTPNISARSWPQKQTIGKQSSSSHVYFQGTHILYCQELLQYKMQQLSVVEWPAIYMTAVQVAALATDAGLVLRLAMPL